MLTAYIQDKSEAIHASEARPAVLIFPGGGYEFVSDPEGEPVALAYAAKGFQTFVLKYSVKDKGVFPAPQREAFEAIAVIRRNAAEFMVDPDKIAVVGFSAGGHLAASTGVFGTTPKLMTRRTPKSADRMRSFSSIPVSRRENLLSRYPRRARKRLGKYRKAQSRKICRQADSALLHLSYGRGYLRSCNQFPLICGGPCKSRRSLRTENL